MIEPAPFRVVQAGRLAYPEGVELQRGHLEEVLAGRASGSPELGRILIVEHEPVITVTRRADAPGHVLFSKELLAQRGVSLHETDRGGDVTYHGPGQLVCYPIVDLNRLHLRIHEYMRTLEEGVIRTLAHFDIVGSRDSDATGVWIPRGESPSAKVCAMGVRVRRWVSMHGLAINVDPDMSHFGLIVPCGLAGRPVTSLKEIAGDRCPSMNEVAGVLIEELSSALLDARDASRASKQR
ncbi:MAG: lipoyl(octanoyl) transferase LipB [Phycisphaerales bacterium]